MLGLLLVALYLGAVVAVSYYFAYSDSERSERPRPLAPAAPPRPPLREEEQDLF